MRKTRHVWANGNEHVKVHRSGGGGGGDSGCALFLWIGGIILAGIILYTLWDIISVLLCLGIFGCTVNFLFKK